MFSLKLFLIYTILLHFNQNFSGGGPPDPPPLLLPKGQWLLKKSFYINNAPPPHAYQTSKSRARRKYKEWKHCAPKHTLYTPFGFSFLFLFVFFFFFCFSMSDPSFEKFLDPPMYSQHVVLVKVKTEINILVRSTKLLIDIKGAST